MKYKTIIKKYEEYQEKNKLNDLLAILIRKASKYSSKQDIPLLKIVIYSYI